MKLKLEMEIDNAAFDDAGELARCLAAVASRIEEQEEQKHDRSLIVDANGNRVGWFTVD